MGEILGVKHGCRNGGKDSDSVGERLSGLEPPHANGQQEEEGNEKRARTRQPCRQGDNQEDYQTKQGASQQYFMEIVLFHSG
ncbi:MULTISPECIES: hypothetical protein [unclassified Parabacteroides]|uniref:hypothetical protein n=1 Tax=unclassified Parabacteroides TaxID=2649774 RepID=UPI00247613F7|nr:MULTISPECIES: hypothetical protein [unclassified Parabacteroides]